MKTSVYLLLSYSNTYQNETKSKYSSVRTGPFSYLYSEASTGKVWVLIRNIIKQLSIKEMDKEYSIDLQWKTIALNLQEKQKSLNAFVYSSQ